MFHSRRHEGGEKGPLKDGPTSRLTQSSKSKTKLTLLVRFYTFGHVKQLKLFKNTENAHGGSLRNKRKGRGARPIATKHTMHLVLRSSHAKGKWRFQSKRNTWKPILRKFAAKYGVKILSMADPGNHIHLHIQLTNRYTYNPFIRAVTAAIAMAITGASRWKKVEIKFWDKRPFSRVVIGRRAFLTVSDYVRVNELEAQGDDRPTARQGVANYRANTG